MSLAAVAAAVLVAPAPAGLELSGNVREKLSGPLSANVREKLSARVLDDLDLRRLRLGLSIPKLAAEAGINEKSYRRLMSGHAGIRTLVLVREALTRRERQARTGSGKDVLILATYGGFLAGLCRAVGLDPAAAHGQDPRAGATGSARWRQLAHARQAAIYLTNTALDVSQRRLAEALNLTPAAVCLALRSVEARRDDAAFDDLLSRLARDVTGVAA